MSNFVLILGANSDVAKELAREYARAGYSLYLASRDTNSLNKLAVDIKTRFNTEVKELFFDAMQFDAHKNFYESLNPKPLGVIYIAGYMCDQKEAESSLEKTLHTININYTGAVSILNIIANDFEARKYGFIVGVSSVAGDRGRAKNYIYGSAKAGFSAYLSGLRNRLSKSNIQVLTVKPGFILTKMTEHLKLPPKLTATPQEVARDIFLAQQKGKDVIYSKWIWRYIMLVIRHIPESIFKKMDI